MERQKVSSTQYLTFSPDSKRLAYVSITDGRQRVVVDGVEGPEYERVSPPEFSPDSQRVGYTTRTGERMRAVVDGVPSKEYTSILKPGVVFSSDSKHVGYAATYGEQCVVVIDGEESKKYDRYAGDITFSPDGRRRAYVAIHKDHEFVVLDGQEQQDVEGIRSNTLVFSPDSRHFAYAAIDFKNDQEFVVVDGVKSEKWFRIAEGNRLVFLGPDLLQAIGTMKDAQGVQTVFRAQIKIMEGRVRQTGN